jgi:hypothetical protein
MNERIREPVLLNSRKSKIAVRRKTVLFHFRENEEYAECKKMSDAALLELFIEGGYFEQEDTVYPTMYKGQLPEDCIDAETVGDITGWPCSLDNYYKDTESSASSQVKKHFGVEL